MNNQTNNPSKKNKSKDTNKPQKPQETDCE